MKNEKNFLRRNRNFIQFVIFMLLPVFLNYFSPVLPVEGLFKGIIAISLVLYVVVFLTSIFMGRVFCGYLCPFGGMQMLVDKAMNKKLKDKKGLRSFRLCLNTIWMALLVSGFVINLSNLKLELFYNMENYISVDSSGSLIRYYIIVFSIMTFAIIFGKMGGCFYICPMAFVPIWGTSLGRFLRIKSLKVKKNSNNCIGCKKCNKSCPMSLDVAQLVQKETMYHVECINCGECEVVCPKGCIDYKFQEDIK